MRLLRDGVDLAELQLQLFAADGRECGRKSTPPLAMAAAGVIIAASGLPLLLVALAYALVELAGLPVWFGMLCGAISGFVIGGVLVLVGMRWLRPQLAIWERSTGELKRNLEWLKETVRSESDAERDETPAEGDLGAPGE